VLGAELNSLSIGNKFKGGHGPKIGAWARILVLGPVHLVFLAYIHLPICAASLVGCAGCGIKFSIDWYKIQGGSWAKK
jgi:hypothetical protein